MDEAKLKAATIGEPAVLNGTVALQEYDPRWPLLFVREAQRIKRILGDRALQIEHVGSTSVPGLTAKPIIDILLVVASSAAEETYVAPLETAGYQLRIRESDWHEHRLLKGPETNVNLHVFSESCPEITRMLAFRNRLRADEAERELYESEKRRLAQRQWKYLQDYADAKTEVVEQILARALSKSDDV